MHVRRAVRLGIVDGGRGGAARRWRVGLVFGFVEVVAPNCLALTGGVGVAFALIVTIPAPGDVFAHASSPQI